MYGGTLRAVEGALDGCLHVTCLTPASLEHALGVIYGQSQDTTWNRTVATVGSFLRWCAASGVIPASSVLPTSLPMRRKVTAERSRGNTDLLAFCFDENLPLRDRTIWCLTFDLCLGPDEVLQLDIEDIDVKKKAVRVNESLLFWQPFSSGLVSRVVADRPAGPVFLADRVRPPSARRLSYRRAAESCRFFTGHRLGDFRSGGLTYLQERGAPLALIRTRSTALARPAR